MRKEILTNKKYLKAFACITGDCPQSVEGCPMWSEIIQTNISNGEERMLCGCYPQISLLADVEVIKASNRPAAAVESTRNEIVKGFEKVTNTVVQVMYAIQKTNLPTRRISELKTFMRKMLG